MQAVLSFVSLSIVLPAVAWAPNDPPDPVLYRDFPDPTALYDHETEQYFALGGSEIMWSKVRCVVNASCGIEWSGCTRVRTDTVCTRGSSDRR